MKQQFRRSFLVATTGVCSLLAGAMGAQISDLADGLIETCLNEGKIGKSAGKIQGVTRRRRLEIECSVGVDPAVFKVVDDQRRGLPAKVGGFQEMNLSDSYKYERAAYLLDRELGLNLVPVAVIREVKGTEGALLVRRDLILDKIDQDCPEWTREAVFTDWQEAEALAEVDSSNR